MKLRNWSVVSSNGDPRMKLAGQIYEHSFYKDGDKIVTSPIKKVLGRNVITINGSIYQLDGEPETEYLEFLKFIGYDYDSENPIRTIARKRNAKKEERSNTGYD